MSMPQIESRPASEIPPDCMVVIPARNEEKMIGRAVKSLPHDTVIVVDDHSGDATAGVARAAGAGVLPAPALVRGARGKANACMAGARILKSKWILFADADTWYEPGFLESAVAAAETSKVDFLSIYLKPSFETISEKILAPFAVALYFFGVDPRSNPAQAFNGQCVLVRREAYEFVGGHAAVLTQVFEDLKLVALAERHRMKFGIARASYLGHVRIRPATFERNAHRFTMVNAGVGIRIMLGALACVLWGPTLAWLLLGRHWIAAVVFGLWPVVLLSGWYGWQRALLAPFGIYGMVPILLRGFVGALTGRSVEWKGRVI